MTSNIESTRTFSPLGIRFWDGAAGLPITDGLRVTTWSTSQTEYRVAAYRNRSGIYVFAHLPGLREVEWLSPDDPVDAPLSSAVLNPFVVSVEDLRGRYLPAARRIPLPLAEFGSFPLIPAGSLPGETADGFCLFAAPNREPACGQFGIRAELLDIGRERPAAHAMLVVRSGEKRWYGMADAQGRVLLLGAYPPITTTLEGSPPAGQLPLREQTWTISVEVRYSPDEQSPLPGTPLPDHRQIFGQSPARIHRRVADTLAEPPLNQLDVSLSFGEPLVLKTEGDYRLHIEAAGPPP